MVTKLVVTHSTWMSLHDIGRVLSRIVQLMLASVLITIIHGCLLRSLELLLALQGLCRLLAIDLCQALDHDSMLLGVVERVHKEFVFLIKVALK